MSHLWTEDAPPLEYVVHVVAKEWSCTPSQARKESARDFAQTLAILSAEGAIGKAKGR